MKYLKIMALFTMFMMVFAVGGSAKADSFHDTVEQLLLLTKQDQILEQTFEQIKPMLLQQYQLMNIPEAKAQIMHKYLGKILDVMKDEMSWDQIKEEYIQIYMAVYTEDEVRELIKFYQSPIGQKTVAEMPLLMQQSMLVSQNHLKNILPKIQEISKEMAAEINSNAKP
ncbi:MAG: DUF2059 domain-containing protein [Dehalococcoidales bacterium]|nr:DUF2059 domain-containing protein [Dehalococcoidales bacterium]